MEKTLTGYDEIELLETKSIFSFEEYRSMSLFDMKKFIVLDSKLIYIKDNQFKWEFAMDEECILNIKGILNENEKLFDIHNLTSAVDEQEDNYKFYFNNGERSHTIYTSKISYPEENGMILQWNSKLDEIQKNLIYVLDVFYKIVEVIDSSNLELDIKREFKLEKELDEPFYKRYVAQEKESANSCWIVNMDSNMNKHPWNLRFNGDIVVGFMNLNGNFENKKALMDAIKRSYGNKIASHHNVDCLWNFMQTKSNDIIYLTHQGHVKFKCIVSKGYQDGIVRCKKSYYLIDVPFNANRYHRSLLTNIEKGNELCSYFDGSEKDRVDVFPLRSQIQVGPIEVIKEKTIRKQQVYLISDYNDDGLMTLYRDKIGNHYMSDQNYFEGFNRNYEFTSMEIIEPLEYTIDEGEPVVIEPKDFITRSNLIGCRHHKLVHLTLRFKVVDLDGHILEVYCPAYYCNECNRYYLMDEDYDRVKNYGVMLCRLVNEAYWQESQNITFRGYNEESLLHTLGYNVTQKDNLSDEQRWRILEVAVDQNTILKEDIVQFLDFLIHSRNSSSNMETALKKWKKDKEHILQYELNSHPISIYKKVYLNEYIRLL